MNKQILFLSWFILTCFSVRAQSCLENLFNANKILDAGKPAQCLRMAEVCSHESNDLSVRWQAFRLMSVSHMYLGHADSALFFAEKMYELNPRYQPNLLKDPGEFISLLKKITVIPKFSFGLAFSLGPNQTIPVIKKEYVVSDYSKKYHSDFGYQFGTNLGFHISPSMVVDAGIYATVKKYSIDYSFSNWKTSVNERLTYLDLPITFRYILRPQKTFRPYVSAGFFGGYLLYANNDFKTENTTENKTFEFSSISSIDRRVRYNWGLTGSVGVYFKIKEVTTSIQAGYYHSFVNISKSSTRYDNPELTFSHFYLDDELMLNNFGISIGFTQNLNYKIYRKKNKI